ncbi:MAG: hypothetical protein LBK60_01175 [Verrucomicrobiales bacterium]|nr:hypothetical protein [Verrucomicrobiales bacterium]
MNKTLLFILALTVATARGAVEYTEAEGAGSGKTEAVAVVAALRACVAQVCGVDIAGDTNLSIVSVTLAGNGGDKSKVSEKLRHRVSESTKGRVASYQILDVNPNAADGVTARVSAKIARYLDPQTQRKRLALVPFRAAADGFIVSGKKVPAADITSELSQALAVNLVSARKFAVLDREYLNEISREHQLIASSAVSDDELCKLGALAGADYLVCGTLRDFTTASEALTVPGAGGATVAQLTGGAALGLRILDVATSQIKFADSLNFRLLLAGAGQSTSMELCDIAAAGLAQKIMEAIYPLMVISADGGEVVLNQGGEMVRAGARYELFTFGAEMIDPVTGESLGRREKKCATVEIVESKPKFSEARVLEQTGDLAELLKQGKIAARPQK